MQPTSQFDCFCFSQYSIKIKIDYLKSFFYLCSVLGSFSIQTALSCLFDIVGHSCNMLLLPALPRRFDDWVLDPESILPNCHFSVFPIFAVKLGHIIISTFFSYVTNTQAYQQKTEKFFVSEEIKFGRIDSRSRLKLFRNKTTKTTLNSNIGGKMTTSWQRSHRHIVFYFLLCVLWKLKATTGDLYFLSLGIPWARKSISRILRTLQCQQVRGW